MSGIRPSGLARRVLVSFITYGYRVFRELAQTGSVVAAGAVRIRQRHAVERSAVVALGGLLVEPGGLRAQPGGPILQLLGLRGLGFRRILRGLRRRLGLVVLIGAQALG